MKILEIWTTLPPEIHQIIYFRQFLQKINGQTLKFARKLHFLDIRKVLNLGLKSKKPLQNENHTEDWALGSHPRDNGLKS